ncbi:hypothetical protein Tco_0452173 [Tanacetum coccineum]
MHRVRHANMLNKSSKKHPIGKSHIDTLGYTNHSIDDVVDKIEVFSSGKTVEHVAETSIRVVLVPFLPGGVNTHAHDKEYEECGKIPQDEE